MTACTPDALLVSFTVAVDTREQRPFAFTGLVADAKEGRLPLVITTVTQHLATGDYSIEGLEDHVAVERKSLADLFDTLGRGRKRFERELHRLSRYEFAAVVVEADWAAIVATPPERSQLRPKVVFRSVIAWQLQHPRIHWWFLPNRRLAELTTFRLLERFWKCHQRKGLNS